MKLFNRAINITDRVLNRLDRQRQKHLRHAERLDRIASDASERARQHRDASAAFSEALDALSISQNMTLAAHEALAADIGRDIAVAKLTLSSEYGKMDAYDTKRAKLAASANAQFENDYLKYGVPL